MPFDLEHRRLTFYTLNNKDKAVVRKNIRNIIADTVMNVIENGVRPKNGMAAYRIGSYVNGEIVSDIVKYNPINSDYLKKNYDAWIKKIKSLVDEINTIKLSCGTTEISESDDITERLTKPRKKEIYSDGFTAVYTKRRNRKDGNPSFIGKADPAPRSCRGRKADRRPFGRGDF